jgi:dTDP-4-dehydrorhamnose 3,5-epimerase
MFDVVETSIPGCLKLAPIVREDSRGRFVKVFHDESFAEHRMTAKFAEQYYSRSHKGVLRGLHFQEPPFDHSKLVYCVEGVVIDAVVDLRVGSPSYGEHVLIELSAERANQVFVPAGLAHGIYVASETAMIVSNTSTVYAPDADKGIAWDSAGIDWPDVEPILSQRDASLPTLSDYESPFRYA